MHRSGATPRQNEDKLNGLAQLIKSRWESVNLNKSTPSNSIPRLSEVAMRGMRLNQQPFAPPVGEQSYYSDEMTQSLLGELQDTILQSDGLIVLVGDPDSGKTCSIAQLMQTLYDSSTLFLARGSAAQSAEIVVRNMLGAFRSTTPSQIEDCLEQLGDYLSDSAQSSAASVLILEDADLLERRELQLLLNHLDHLNERLDGALKLLFTSALPAEQLLSGQHSDQVTHGRVEEFRQPLLDAEQVMDYIDARLLMGGSDRELPLNERARHLITETTHGLPGVVDQVTAEALNGHFKKHQYKALLSPAHWTAATRKSAKWLMFGGTLLLTGLAMAFFSGNAPLDRDGTTVREIPVPVEAAELQLVPPALEPTPTSAVAPQPEPTASAPTQLAEATPPPPPAEAAAEPVQAPAPTAVAETAQQQAPEATTAAAPEPEPVITPAPAATVATGDDFIGGVVSGHQWILRRDPARFTAQMAAGWSERDLRLFATGNGLTNKTAIYRTERDGKGWFSLVHGDFDSPAEATRAIAELPAVLRRDKPWIRSFGGIQTAIK